MVEHDNAKEKMDLDSKLIGYIPTRYLNQKQACIYANTSPKTINEWKVLGLRLIFVEGEVHPKYDIKDIDEFLEKYKTKEVIQ